MLSSSQGNFGGFLLFTFSLFEIQGKYISVKIVQHPKIT